MLEMQKAKPKGERVQLLRVPMGVSEKDNRVTLHYDLNMRNYTLIN